MIYKLMDRPDILTNNKPKTSIDLLSFIFRRKHLSLNDKELSILSDVMLIYFITYIMTLVLTIIYV